MADGQVEVLWDDQNSINQVLRLLSFLRRNMVVWTLKQ